jgi:hypothetical protein
MLSPAHVPHLNLLNFMGFSKFEYSRPDPTMDLGIQTLHILHRFPEFTYRRERGVVVWRGRLQPRPLSQKYRVEIRYKHYSFPNVRVVDTLTSKAPHLYRDGTLCLFYPKESPWQRDMLIATTILPWTALWLYYYELWLDTGKWLGPSSHTSDLNLQEWSTNSNENNEFNL